MLTPLDDELILEAFGLSIVAFMVVVALHLIGLHAAVRLFRSRIPVHDLSKLRFHHTVLVILAVMFLLFTLHLLTNFAWGAFIVWMGVLPHYRDGVYYSLENYTSLGLTRVTVDDHWRMLAPMISLSGVFCLSWSTAVLVSFFGHLYSLANDDD